MASEEGTATVQAQRANVRKGPGMKYAVITTVVEGEQYLVKKKAGGWLELQLNDGRSGWIWGKLVLVEVKPKGPFGSKLDSYAKDIKHYLYWLIPTLLLAGIAFALWNRWRNRMEREVWSSADEIDPSQVFQKPSVQEDTAVDFDYTQQSQIECYFEPEDIINERYAVQKISMGGFGCVYMCLDSMQGKACALKTLHWEKLSGDLLFENFIQESLRWISIGAHPHIVYAYGVEDVSRIPYVVMEYVEGHPEYGTNLLEWIENKPTDWKDAIRFGVQISAGMIHAYNRLGLIHHDLKPENVLVTKKGLAKVTDFGCSAVSSGGTASPGGIGFTGIYGAPEQWQPKAPVDTRTDIYATGVILFEIAARTPPFYDPHSLEHDHLNLKPPDPRELDDSIPESLANLILSCLEKSPDRRPSGFQELLKKLKHLHRELLGKKLPISREMPDLPADADAAVNQINSLDNLGMGQEALQLAEEFAEKHPDHPGLQIALGSVLDHMERPGDAVDHFQLAHNLDSDRIEPIVNLALDYAKIGNTEEARKWCQLAMDRSDNAYALQPLTAVMSEIVGPEEALWLCDRLLEQDSDLAVVWNNRAGILRRMGNLDEALESATQAVEINYRYAKAWSNRATVFASLGRYDEAELSAEKALHIDPLLIGANSALCLALVKLDRPDEAIERLKSALKNLPKAAILWQNLAVAYAATGNHSSALKCIDKALQFDPSLEQSKALKRELTSGTEIVEDFPEMESLDYFEQPPHPGTALCSYPPCPCDEVSIPQGEGYLYVTKECVEFRRNARTFDEAEKKLGYIQDGIGAVILSGYGEFSPILMCEEGAKMLDLDLDTAAADARRWWKTGMVPLAPTPKGGDFFHPERVNSVAFCPDGRHVLTGGWYETLYLWDTYEKKQVLEFVGHNDFVSCVAVSPDGRRAISGGADCVLHVWDLKTGQETARLKGHSFTIFHVAFSPDGRLALTGSGDKSVRLWDIERGKKIRKFGGRFSGKHTEYVNHVGFSPSGRRAISCGGDGTFRVWDVETGRELECFEAHSSSVETAAFLPDRRHVLSSGNDIAVRLWDLNIGIVDKEFSGMPPAAVSPDGNRVVFLAYPSDNNEFRPLTLVYLKSGEEILRLEGHKREVKSLSFSSDGRFLASGSDDQTIRIWEL